MPHVTVGRRSGEHVCVEVMSRELPHASDFDDGNWLTCRVSLRVGAFSGSYAAALRSEEFEEFLTNVRQLNATLSGNATFDTMEGQLRVAIERVGSLGALQVNGEARDRAGTGNKLAFEVADFDQSDLPSLITELEGVMAEFPVVGRRQSEP